MEPVHLADGHLPLPELRGSERFAKVPHHQVAIELFLLGEPGGIDRRELGEENAILRDVSIDRRLREIAELVVVALVAEYRREFGRGAHRVFPLFVEKRVQRLDPRLHWRQSTGGGVRMIGASPLRQR